MDFKDVTKKEAAIMLMIQAELDKNDSATINKICAMLKERALFSSAFAKRYENELMHISDEEATQRMCVSCGTLLHDDEFCLCNDCRLALTEYSKDAEDTEPVTAEFKDNNKNSDSETKYVIKDLTKEEAEAINKKTNTVAAQKKQAVSRKRRLNLTKPLLIACAAFIIVIVTLVIFLVRSKSESKSMADYNAGYNAAVTELLNALKTGADINASKDTASSQKNGEANDINETDILESFDTFLNAYDYSLLKGTLLDDGSRAYEISPGGDFLILFHDENKNLTGLALQMNDNTEEDQVRQLSFMAFLLASVYSDMDLNAAADFLENDLISGDMVSRGAYAWNIAKIEDKIVFMGIDSRYGTQ